MNPRRQGKQKVNNNPARGPVFDEALDPVMAPPQPLSLHGRGASANPANRFTALHLEPDPDEPSSDEVPSITTKFYRDFTRTIIAHNDSPDVGFESSLNPYRGCEHGCIYCYARPTHEFLGFSAGLDFESRIMVKQDAPELLAAELSAPRWKPQVLVMSGVTDPYQPVERRLKITRGCLEVLARFRNPVGIITKNQLVTRTGTWTSYPVSPNRCRAARSGGRGTRARCTTTCPRRPSAPALRPSGWSHGFASTLVSSTWPRSAR